VLIAVMCNRLAKIGLLVALFAFSVLLSRSFCVYTSALLKDVIMLSCLCIKEISTLSSLCCSFLLLVVMGIYRIAWL
jgi:hypothetical protein